MHTGEYCASTTNINSPERFMFSNIEDIAVIPLQKSSPPTMPFAAFHMAFLETGVPCGDVIGQQKSSLLGCNLETLPT